MPHEEDVRHWRLTVDTQADLDLCGRIIDAVGSEGSMYLEVLREHINTHPDLLAAMQENMSAHAK